MTRYQHPKDIAPIRCGLSLRGGIDINTLDGEPASGYCIGDVIAESIGAPDVSGLADVLAYMVIDLQR